MRRGARKGHSIAFLIVYRGLGKPDLTDIRISFNLVDGVLSLPLLGVEVSEISSSS